jgi:hypothetical protein
MKRDYIGEIDDGALRPMARKLFKHYKNSGIGAQARTNLAIAYDVLINISALSSSTETYSPQELITILFAVYREMDKK